MPPAPQFGFREETAAQEGASQLYVSRWPQLQDGERRTLVLVGGLATLPLVVLSTKMRRGSAPSLTSILCRHSLC